MRGAKRADGLDGMVATPTFLRDKIAALKAKPVGIAADHFVCIKCSHHLPNSQIGKRFGFKKTAKQCITCCRRKPTSAASKRSVAKRYRLGNLPWFAKA